MEYPTPQTVDEWDDASLFAVTGYRAATRASTHGFASLNDVESTLCCLFGLVGEVLNGGFGQWLFNLHPHVIAHTASACEAVGATSAKLVVEQVLSTLQDPRSFAEFELWFDYLFALPEDQQQRIERYTLTDAEHELHGCAYRYARERWVDVRAA